MDIFENTGSLNWLCAVKSYEKYLSISNVPTPNQPLFTLQDGSGYTGRMFNKDVETLLTGKIDNSLGPLITHSFRAEMATMMAEAGCSDDQIQLAGICIRRIQTVCQNGKAQESSDGCKNL